MACASDTTPSLFGLSYKTRSQSLETFPAPLTLSIPENSRQLEGRSNSTRNTGLGPTALRSSVPQAREFKYLVPNWQCCFEMLGNLQEVGPSWMK